MWDQFSLSSGSGFTKYSQNGDILSLTGEVDKSNPRCIVQAANSDAMRYAVIENPEHLSSYEFSFKEMLPFDQEVKFTFPMTDDADLFVRGRAAGVPIWGPGNTINAHYLGYHEHTSLTAGYLNLFDSYTTSLLLQYATHRLFYYNYNVIPTQDFDWPDPTDFKVNSNNVGNFSSKVPKQTWRKSYWQSSTADPAVKQVVTWTVYSQSPNHVLKSLPNEIASLSAQFDFDNFVYLQTTYYTKGQTYKSFIESKFAGNLGDEDKQVGITLFN